MKSLFQIKLSSLNCVARALLVLILGAVPSVVHAVPNAGCPEGEQPNSLAAPPSSDTACFHMQVIESIPQNEGLTVVQGGDGSCIEQMKQMIISIANEGQRQRLLDGNCLSDDKWKTRLNTDICGEADDYTWYAFALELPVWGYPNKKGVAEAIGKTAGDVGGVTFALHKKDDGTCEIDPTKTSFCDTQAGQATTTEVLFVAEPISLVWDEEAAKKEEARYVLFPLDLRSQRKLYQWRASANRPLLVFDPGHIGQITSAAQLFGNWTFGGKKIARADYRTLSDVFGETGTAWENGYQALGTLDMNGDHKISGEELNPLALWFDNNRDGVSQAGEVVSLAEARVDMIYISPDRSDRHTGDLIATRGYERTLPDGTRVRGASIDWMAQGYSSPVQIMMLQHDELGLPSLGFPAYMRDTAEDGLASYSGNNPVKGLWEWRVTSFSDFKVNERDGQKGLLSLSVKEGKLSGGTVSETPLQANPLGVTSIMQLNLLNGHTELDKNGNIVLKFDVGTEGSSVTKSEARLLDTNGMVGVSTVEIGKGKNGQPILLSYTWKAKRVR